jgi:predicted ATPase
MLRCFWSRKALIDYSSVINQGNEFLRFIQQKNSEDGGLYLKISKLHVSNYRCFEHLQLDNLGKIVCLAGANGSGKSSILDLINLICGTRKGYTSFINNNWAGNTSDKSLIIDYELSDGDAGIRTGAVPPPGIFNLAKTQPGNPELGERGTHTFDQNLYDNTKDHFILYSPLRSFVLEDFGEPRVPQFEEKQYRSHSVVVYNERSKRLTALMTRFLHRQREYAIRESLAGKDVINRDYIELDVVHGVFNRFFKVTGKKFLMPRTSEDGRMSFFFSTPWSVDPLPLSALSSGEQWLLFFFLELRLNEWGNHVVLIDEIENHLHPHLALEFVKELRIAKDDNQYWITTHNPSIARYLSDFTYGLVPNHEHKTEVVGAESIDLLSTLTGYEAVIPIARTIVLLEGSTIQGRELSIDETFFEELREMNIPLDHVQFVSVGHSSSVTDMNQAFQYFEDALKLGWKLYAIRDRDAMSDNTRLDMLTSQEGRLWIWERSSLEGYFVEPSIVSELLQSKRFDPLPDEYEIENLILKVLENHKVNILERYERHLVFSHLPKRGASTLKWLQEATTVATSLEQDITDFKNFIDSCVSSKDWRKLLPYMDCKKLIQNVYGRFLKKSLRDRENFVDLIRDIMRDVIKVRMDASENKQKKLELIWPEISRLIHDLSEGSSFTI